MKLTIGMAVAGDYDGVYFTIQSTRIHQDCSQVEFLVVDNDPKSVASKDIRHFVERIGGRYFAMHEPKGTSPPRNAVFWMAKTKYVMCVDSHVVLFPNTISRLLKYYESHPETNDLYTGPIVYDPLNTFSTHFNPEWRSEMHGIWGLAWKCDCKDNPLLFSPAEKEEHSNKIKFYKVSPSQDTGDEELIVTKCHSCGKGLPMDLPFGGHEQHLYKMGYRAQINDADEPYDIYGQGLGLFTCRQEAWLGFNKHFEQFGGEELYIHEKFRQAGAHCVNLPWLKWNHRFGRPGGHGYSFTRYSKVRNYVLGHLELGWSLDPIYQHFVSSGKMNKMEWDHLVADPVAHNLANAKPKFAGKPQGLDRESLPSKLLEPKAPTEKMTIEEIYLKHKEIPRDLNEHFHTLRSLAEKCSSVTEFTERKESTIAFAAAKDTKLTSYNQQEGNDPILLYIEAVSEGRVKIEKKTSLEVQVIQPTDLLFIDTKHTRDRVALELAKFGEAAQKYIVFHDTQLHGRKGADGGPGILESIRDFVVKNPDWFVASHATHQYGLTVLSKLPEDRPPKPFKLWPKGYGPGTKLLGIMQILGIKAPAGCSCKQLAEEMDEAGADGCLERIDHFVEAIKTNAAGWGWKDAIENLASATANAITHAIIVNPLDPIRSLVKRAIKEARKEEAEKAKSEGGVQ